MPTLPDRTEKTAILFADISGSTGLYGALGDARAREKIAHCLGLMTRNLPAHQGTLIKTIGDEIMCIFPSAANAFRAACAMQDAVEGANARSDVPMYVRIGFHFGEVIRTADDVYGDAVNIAARIAGVARARHIVATQAAVGALPPELRNKTQRIWRAPVKGKEEELDVFQILWREDDAGTTRVGIPHYRKPPESQSDLRLSYREQSLRVGAQCRRAMLGRDASCQIVVLDPFASRQHARIELRAGHFVLADQSVNGTYVGFADGQSVHVVREEILLRGSGRISLGRAFSEDAVQIIEFALPSNDGKP